ncbi:MAG: XrtA system polysaccharide deacetylase [Candidatus Acidiferrales bacterium]
MKCIFSIDVEDWFHLLDLPSTPHISKWGSLPSRVETNFLRLLDILDETNAQATCFFLGWVAERFPHLVREAAKRGHEISSHGYGHILAYQVTAKEFYEDAVRAKKAIEDISGQPVWGYRASGFSVTEEIPWFFETLIEADYRYDSSVFPAPRGHGGMRTGNCAPYEVKSPSAFVEFPVSVEHVAGYPICFFGGGYLRLFPYSVIRNMARRVLRQGRPVIFYVHPREIDLRAPRLAMGMKRRFKCYVNIETTEPKIRSLLSEFEVVTFRDFIDNEFEQLPTLKHLASATHGGNARAAKA